MYNITPNIYVWTLRIPSPRETPDPAALLMFLPPLEIERYHHFKNISAQRRFLLGRYVMRIILAELLTCLPQDVPIVITESGKPVLTSGVFHFNLSHNKTHIVFALSHQYEVGIDIESLQRKTDHLAISQHYFHPKEHEKLQSLCPQDQKSYFTKLWTLKEATVKLLGSGILSHSRTLHFNISDGNEITLLSPLTEENICYKLVEVTSTQILAVAWRDGNHRFKQFGPANDS